MPASFQQDRTYDLDANLELVAENTTLTISGPSGVVLDLQGNQGTSPKQQARIDFSVIFDVAAIKTSANNETYRLLLLGSNDVNFGPGSVEMLGELMLGAGGTRDGANMMASVAGRYEIMISNQQAGVIYEFVQLYVVVGGTAPSITLLDAFACRLPRI